MTSVHRVLLPAVMVVGSVSTAAADVSGMWRMRLATITTSIPEVVCTLSQKDGELSGTCREAAKVDGQTFEFVDGRIDGEKVSWKWRGTFSDGNPFTFSITGTVEAKETMMKGSFEVNAPGYSDAGSFTATKQ